LDFLDIVSTSVHISNSTKMGPVGVELFHGDRQTDGRADGRTHKQT